MRCQIRCRVFHHFSWPQLVRDFVKTCPLGTQRCFCLYGSRALQSVETLCNLLRTTLRTSYKMCESMNDHYGNMWQLGGNKKPTKAVLLWFYLCKTWAALANNLCCLFWLVCNSSSVRKKTKLTNEQLYIKLTLVFLLSLLDFTSTDFIRIK